MSEAGVDFPAKEKARLAERKNGYYKELIGTVTPCDLQQGWLHPPELAVASVSHKMWEVVRRLGIEELIIEVVSTATVFKGKPDPGVFFAQLPGGDPGDRGCADVGRGNWHRPSGSALVAQRAASTLEGLTEKFGCGVAR